MKNKIAILGAGNMGTPIAISLTESYGNQIHVYDRNIDKCERLTKEHNVVTYSTPSKNNHYDCVIIAIKPYQISESSELIKSMLKKEGLIISVAAGIPVKDYINLFGQSLTIVRAMPNIAAKYKLSATAAFCRKNSIQENIELANDLLLSIGKVIWLEDEQQMHLATAIAGSAIAYYFNFVKHQIEIAKDMGMSYEQSIDFAKTTLSGAAQMCQNEDLQMQDLINQVTSPNGVTEYALKAMESANINYVLKQTINAAIKRSEELGN